ncbi:hypothetical protein B0H14DRAFT_2586896 [Mycena olivaceomarginata]|nr:hypothetical protein B0H14DRAFT_2586896 [Mycena olivaceomarginata]
MKTYTQTSIDDAKHERRCQRTADKKARRSAAEKQRQAEEAAAHRAVQNKRDQWKVASARYYERHPEVKERKRLKAAEKRAVKKLARRRWDPPSVSERRRNEQQLGNFGGMEDLNVDPDLEQHRVYLTHNDILEQYLDSLTDAPTSTGSKSGSGASVSARTDAAESLLVLCAQLGGESNVHHSNITAWSRVAPDYDSRSSALLPIGAAPG